MMQKNVFDFKLKKILKSFRSNSKKTLQDVSVVIPPDLHFFYITIRCTSTKKYMLTLIIKKKKKYRNTGYFFLEQFTKKIVWWWVKQHILTMRKTKRNSKLNHTERIPYDMFLSRNIIFFDSERFFLTLMYLTIISLKIHDIISMEKGKNFKEQDYSLVACSSIKMV